MISLGTVFWLMVFFFGLIGMMRGWTKEVIATAGLILSLFTINQFGFSIVTLVTAVAPGDIYNELFRRQQFYYLGGIHTLIAFFSYQGPTLAGRGLMDRLRVRDNLQDKLLGGIVGAVNGYLIVGTLWALLEYVRTIEDWVSLPGNMTYPFGGNFLLRPAPELNLIALISGLPLPLLDQYLPFLLVIVFLFVLVVMI